MGRIAASGIWRGLAELDEISRETEQMIKDRRVRIGAGEEWLAERRRRVDRVPEGLGAER